MQSGRENVGFCFFLALEYVAADKRGLMGNMSLAFGFSAAGILVPVLMNWLRDWKQVVLILGLQHGLVLLTPL